MSQETPSSGPVQEDFLTGQVLKNSSPMGKGLGQSL